MWTNRYKQQQLFAADMKRGRLIRCLQFNFYSMGNSAAEHVLFLMLPRNPILSKNWQRCNTYGAGAIVETSRPKVE